ncbi:MAG: protein-L-isoaspartate(D-aspartate) O-methyltransferase [Candidatus Izemoplasmataceae bacterium]
MSVQKYQFLREKMVKEQILKRGIENEVILDVFEKIPRHRFVRPSDQHLAYNDYPLPIGEEQTISQPYIVAQMVDALALQPEDTVLEIGTGSGYQTAILAEIVGKVYTIERIKGLQDQAKEVLDSLGYRNIEYFHKDGKEGLIEQAPFDKVIVSAASKSIPKELLDQLKDGGKMVIPTGGDFLQKLLLLEKNHHKYKEKILGYCRFVRLI